MRVDTQALEHTARNESRVPRLGESRSGQDLASLIQAPADAGDGRNPRVPALPWQRRRNPVVPVDAADFLDQILRDRDVEPEDRRQHVPIPVLEWPHMEVEALENRL